MDQQQPQQPGAQQQQQPPQQQPQRQPQPHQQPPQQQDDAYGDGSSPPSSSESLLYFAYGSMCNHVSLNRRQLFPSWSRPAVLAGYRLTFQLGGMANIVPDASGRVHGILHRVTLAEFKVLQGIEMHYATIELQCDAYGPHAGAASSALAASGCSGDGLATAAGAPSTSAASVTATAFIVHADKLAEMTAAHPERQNALPSERYIRIISAGLQHYGAEPAWIEWIAGQPVQPSRKPHEYLTAAVDDKQPLPQLSTAEVEARGRQFKDGTSSLAVFCCGAKVLQVDTAQGSATDTTFLQHHFAGRADITYHMCLMLQEPLLPPLSSPADVRPAHIAWAEDMLVEFMQSQRLAVTQIGWLAPGGAESAASAAVAAAEVAADAADALREEDAATVTAESGVLV